MSTIAADALKSFVRRIESLEAEIAERNADKSDVYKEAKGGGFDVAILRKVITYRRKREKHGQAALDEGETIFRLYMEAIEGKPLARARAREQAETIDAETGEIIEDQHLEAGTHQPAPPQPKPGGADGPGKFFDAGPLPEFLDQRGALQ
jgi:uncharacterized protein (UPF0335 family)